MSPYVDQLLVLHSLLLKIDAITYQGVLRGDRYLREEGEICINTLLSRIKQIMKRYEMEKWVHMPRNSKEFGTYKLMRGNCDFFIRSAKEIGARSIRPSWLC